MNEERKENKLGSMPIGPLLFSMAVPMMLSFFIQALYNIVDSMFVAQIAENALTAVSLAFPMQQIMTSIGVGTAVGLSAALPRAMGQRRHEYANELANTGIFLCLCYVALFVFLGFSFTRTFYEMQTNVSEIVEGGVKYLTTIWVMSFGMFFAIYFEKLLTSTGHATYAMIAQASGAIFNIIFDPLLIFGFGPFPKLGIQGAAIATVSGQIFAGIIAFLLNHYSNHWVDFDLEKIFKPNFEAVKEIYRVGIPSMITMGLNSMTSFFVNQILLAYSTTATAVYGIWLKLQNFCFMPAIGMNNGMVPILAYNAGQNRYDRVWGTLKFALMVIVPLMIFLTIVLELTPNVILTMFNASDTLRGIGVNMIRIAVLSLTFGGATFLFSSSMQALRYARFTFVINVCRNFIFPVAFFMTLSYVFHNIDTLWVAIPFTELLGFILALFFYRIMRTQLKEEEILGPN
ncbi:MAG: MATE family efflux transporter [Solobacterium sp.]|nr:MATE family efflux transporter [Solobacterium sp.]